MRRSVLPNTRIGHLLETVEFCNVGLLVKVFITSQKSFNRRICLRTLAVSGVFAVEGATRRRWTSLITGWIAVVSCTKHGAHAERGTHPGWPAAPDALRLRRAIIAGPHINTACI